MKVFIAAPVRDRGRVLERYLKALKAQETRTFKPQYFFLLNDSMDESEEILTKYKMPYRKITTGFNSGSFRGTYSYDNLANLRNCILDEFLASDCDYLFSCDSDILIEKGSLRKLIKHDKDIVSMILNNSPFVMAHNIMIGGRHLSKVPLGLIEVDLTGAVYLIKREVVETGIRYASKGTGEDEGFCAAAKKNGFTLWCDTSLETTHLYSGDFELRPNVDKAHL
jgi:hypothetical protein